MKIRKNQKFTTFSIKSKQFKGLEIQTTLKTFEAYNSCETQDIVIYKGHILASSCSNMNFSSSEKEVKQFSRAKLKNFEINFVDENCKA